MNASRKNLFPILVGLGMTIAVAWGVMGLQAQSLPKLPHLENCDPQGYFFFNTGKLPSGSCFGWLRDSFLIDPLETVEITRIWTDPILNIDHVRYQQYYDGALVEGAEFMEHSKAGYILMANGKFAHGFPPLAIPPITEAEALGKLLTYLGPMDYAWLRSDWEAEIKLDTGDSTATHHPKGTLMWSLDQFTDLGYLISGSRYRLGWRFEILAFGPEYIHKNYFVDAQMGAIYREDELECSNGPANILTVGSRIIDTQPDLFDHQLHATDLGRDIRTKYYDASTDAWHSIPNVKDNDDIWNDDEQFATTAHWMVTQAWDFFYFQFGLEGMDGTGDQVRVYAKWDNRDAAWKNVGGKDYLAFGDIVDYTAVPDFAGHEFTHGVTMHSANLSYSAEPGALSESFSDIFGVMTERYAQGGLYDWTIGEVAFTNPLFVRSLEHPTWQGYHFPAYANCLLLDLGQPDTYEGAYWYGPYGCDHKGVHVNSGVQNHWFYMLSEGAPAFPSPISGIGIEKAGQIAFYSLTNVLISSSQYADARASSIWVARMLYGVCSNEEIQTTNAWAEVGVGLRTTCPTVAVDPQLHVLGNVEVFPNPTAGTVTVRCFGADPDAIRVIDLAGKIVKSKDDGLSALEEIDLSSHSPGMYIFEVVRNGQAQYLKVMLQ